MTPLERITERVNRNGDINDPSTPRPLLTLEEFFDGNTVDGSIWCNCTPTPSPAETFAILREIRDRREVADVRVAVCMFDVPEWPFSEDVYIITDASPDQVKSWFPRAVAPDDIQIVESADNPYEPLEIPAGMHLVSCWWIKGGGQVTPSVAGLSNKPKSIFVVRLQHTPASRNAHSITRQCALPTSSTTTLH